MCLKYARGEYDMRHKPTDMTIDDLKATAAGHNMEVERAADRIHNGARALKTEGKVS